MAKLTQLSSEELGAVKIEAMKILADLGDTNLLVRFTFDERGAVAGLSSAITPEEWAYDGYIPEYFLISDVLLAGGLVGRNEAKAKLIELQSAPDTELAHVEADAVLCGLLHSLGYGDVIFEYSKIDRWFA